LKKICAIAFDFGTKSIGVACGQSVTGTASELEPIPAKDGIPNWLTIENLLAEWQPDIAIIGLPLNMDDSESDFCLRCRKFANRIHGRFGVAIELFDERLTTKLAKEEARERGHDGAYGNNPVDSIAARILLESWFSTQTDSL